MSEREVAELKNTAKQLHELTEYVKSHINPNDEAAKRLVDQAIQLQRNEILRKGLTNTSTLSPVQPLEGIARAIKEKK